MYSDKGNTLAAILKGFLSACNEAQALEAVDVLKDTISDIQNGNLTQEKNSEITVSKQKTSKAKSKGKKKRKISVPLTEQNIKAIEIIASSIWINNPGIAEGALSEAVGLDRTTFNGNKSLHDFYLRLLDGEANIAPVTVNNDPNSYYNNDKE